MIKIGELELYSTWMKDLHGYIVRANGPGLDDKRKMIVSFIPKEDIVILLGGMCSLSTDKLEDSLIRPINDQFGTEIDISKYPETVSRSNCIYRILIKSGQSVIRTCITQDQFETLIANMKVVVHRDIE